MAYEQYGPKINLPAGADLSTHQFKLGKINSSGQVVLCSALGEDADGVITNKPASGELCELQLLTTGGVAMMMAGAAITRGSAVKVLANGKITAAAATSVSGATVVGSYTLGKTLQTATADGDVIAVLCKPLGVVPTTLA